MVPACWLSSDPSFEYFDWMTLASGRMSAAMMNSEKSGLLPPVRMLPLLTLVVISVNVPPSGAEKSRSGEPTVYCRSCVYNSTETTPLKLSPPEAGGEIFTTSGSAAGNETPDAQATRERQRFDQLGAEAEILGRQSDDVLEADGERRARGADRNVGCRDIAIDLDTVDTVGGGRRVSPRKGHRDGCETYPAVHQRSLLPYQSAGPSVRRTLLNAYQRMSLVKSLYSLCLTSIVGRA